jgi:hypothetical protein
MPEMSGETFKATCWVQIIEGVASAAKFRHIWGTPTRLCITEKVNEGFGVTYEVPEAEGLVQVDPILQEAFGAGSQHLIDLGPCIQVGVNGLGKPGSVLFIDEFQSHLSAKNPEMVKLAKCRLG